MCDGLLLLVAVARPPAPALVARAPAPATRPPLHPPGQTVLSRLPLRNGLQMGLWSSKWVFGPPKGSLVLQMGHWSSKRVIGSPNGSLVLQMGH